MTMQERISEDLKSAMKAGDKLRLETLRTLRAALLEKEIELRTAGRLMTPEEEIGVLTSAAKRRRESIESFTAGGRQDLVDQETRELAVIQEYLPQQLGEQEVDGIIAGVIAELGAAGPGDFGKVMPAAMKQLKGKADGRLVQERVKKALGAS